MIVYGNADRLLGFVLTDNIFIKYRLEINRLDKLMLFGRWMFKLEPGLCSYDRYLNLTAAIVFSTVVVMHVASNLGSFITAGVGMPFISRGSVNVMYGVLAGIHAGLLGKEKYLECYEKEEETEA